MSGPDTVVQVEDGAEVVVQMVLVQTCSPKELQTQVLQSIVDTWPGVQLEGCACACEIDPSPHQI